MNMTEVKTAELTGAALDWAVAIAIGYKQEDIDDGCWPFSTDWSQGGPLIEKYKMAVGADYDGGSLVNVWAYVGPAFEGYPLSSAKTHLIAACRAIVAAKLGDIVSVPTELMEAV